MAKAIVLCYEDTDQGGVANELVLLAKVVHVGTDLPGGQPIISRGAAGNGVPITISITGLAQYPNNVEDALIADAARLGLPALARTDCLFPSYTRGA
jgi:hypothetical protein